MRRRLDKVTKSRRTDLQSCFETSPAFVWIGRFLLILSAVSLITSPLTQQLWTWDRFLHGGQDFELAVLTMLTFYCLVVVLSNSCRLCVQSLFAPCPLLEGNSDERESAAISLHGTLKIFQSEAPAGPASRIFSIPLQI